MHILQIYMHLFAEGSYHKSKLQKDLGARVVCRKDFPSAHFTSLANEARKCSQNIYIIQLYYNLKLGK